PWAPARAARNVDVSGDDRPTDAEVAEVAAEAARGVVLDAYKQSRLRDLDVTVQFTEGVLEVDVYVNPPDDAGPDPDEVVEEAIAAAEAAVDDLLGATE
ncbi:MAG: DUF3194 domain-containing protein, partial [Halorientalis sp.]